MLIEDLFIYFFPNLNQMKLKQPHEKFWVEHLKFLQAVLFYYYFNVFYTFGLITAPSMMLFQQNVFF